MLLACNMILIIWSFIQDDVLDGYRSDNQHVNSTSIFFNSVVQRCINPGSNSLGRLNLEDGN
jgi:hypothetical protein